MLLCRTYVFPRFLNPERAEHFVKLAKARLAPSSLAFKKGDTADTTKYAFSSLVTKCNAPHPHTRLFSVCMVNLVALIWHLSTTLHPIWSKLNLDACLAATVHYANNTAKSAHHIRPASYIYEYVLCQQLPDAVEKGASQICTCYTAD